MFSGLDEKINKKREGNTHIFLLIFKHLGHLTKQMTWMAGYFFFPYRIWIQIDSSLRAPDVVNTWAHMGPAESLGSSLVGVAITVGRQVALRTLVVLVDGLSDWTSKGKEYIYVQVFLNVITSSSSIFGKRWSSKPALALASHSVDDSTLGIPCKYDGEAWSYTEQVRTDIGHL